MRPRSTFAKISDGLSKTILLAECAGREDVWRERPRYPANANHAAGENCALAQGGVRFVGETASVQILGQLATRAGGEPASLDSFD